MWTFLPEMREFGLSVTWQAWSLLLLALMQLTLLGKTGGRAGGHAKNGRPTKQSLRWLVRWEREGGCCASRLALPHLPAAHHPPRAREVPNGKKRGSPTWNQ